MELILKMRSIETRQKLVKGVRWISCVVIFNVLFCSCSKNSPAPSKEEQPAAPAPFTQGSNDFGLGDLTNLSRAPKLDTKQALLALFDSINPEIRVRINAGQSEIYTAVGNNHQAKLNELAALPGAGELVTVRLYTNGIVLTPSSLVLDGHVFMNDLTDVSKPRPYVINPKPALRQ